jgi:conjugative relaxase-like TrwC/TraI family protein
VLNIGKLRPGGADYYVGEIATSAEDYYLGHGEAPGRWVGSLAAEIGLHGEVDPDHFRALLEGRHPLTGAQLVEPPTPKTRNVSIRPEGDWLTTQEAADQLGVSPTFVRRLLRTGKLEGEKARSEATGRKAWRVRRAHVNVYAVSHKPAKRRPGFDLTLRPPKSVSVLWALADPDHRAAIRQIHRAAVDEVVRYYEGQAVMGRRSGQRIQTAGLVAAAFDHRTSRAGDPLLHTHVVAANLTLTVADAWRALDGRLLFDHSISGGYLYQAHLRHLLTKRLGVEWRPIVNGMADVAGVPQTVIDEFSQRRDEIEEMLAESGYTSARARQKATLATRRPKDRDVDPDSLANAWRERAAAMGFDTVAVEACFDRTRDPAAPDVDKLFDHLAGPHGLTERASTFTRRDTVRAVAAAMAASTPAIEVERLADRFLASDRVVVLAGPTSGRNSHVVIGLGNRRIRTGGTATYSTPELIDIETGLLRWAEADAGQVGHAALIDHAIATRPELSDEQAAMVRTTCSTARAIQVVVGRPGSGKTYATAACVEALAATGIPVLGCAVSASAAAELEAAVGFERFTRRPAQTMASLIIDLDQRGDRLLSGTVVFVDEASMLGTRDLARLAAHVDRVGGSIKLIGDPDQHGSVDTGGVFKALAGRDDPTIVRLVENRRQRDASERAAIEEYRRGEIADALSRYDGTDKVIRGESSADTYDALVHDWWTDRRAGSRSPMLAGTNAARGALNDRVRVLLKQEGILTGEPLVVNGREFLLGDEVVARRNDRHLHGPRRTDFVKNGSVGRIAVIHHDRGDVDVDFLAEGTVRIPYEYVAAGHLEHGYARTTYGVQGATLDTARYHPSDSSRFEEGYVAITRATDRTSLYVVEGDLDLDDESDPRAVEPESTGFDAVVDALRRRSDQRLGVETDPLAVEASRLARTHNLQQLNARLGRLDEILAKHPPPAESELSAEQWRLHRLEERRDALLRAKPSWKPGRRRDLTRTLTALGQSIDRASQRLHELEAQQALHDAFAAEHQREFQERRVTTRAAAARRLRIRLAVVADPPAALTELLGERPLSQRKRLRWDAAAESAAVYLDEQGRSWPPRAASIGDILGSRPEDPLGRFEQERIAKAMAQAQLPESDLPEHDLGQSVGLA